MKRVLLSILVMGTFVGSASAGMYTLDKTTATQFRQVGSSSPDWGLLLLVVDHSGASYDDPYGLGVYTAATMQGQVGFVGIQADLNDDNLASMRIGGAMTTAAPYDGFRAYIANDSEHSWEYRLYASDGAVTPTVKESGWTTLAPGAHQVLELPFGATMTVAQVGFDVQANYSLLSPPGSFDSFQTSVVPIPPAALLGFLGLGVAGVKLRRWV